MIRGVDAWDLVRGMALLLACALLATGCATAVAYRAPMAGAGPIGLLAAMVGKQRGLDIHVLDRADRKWLGRLITRREKPENFKQALKRKPDDIKVVIQFSEI
jgi:NADPH-dependent 2,4-dienoyl-CoA reductase/sulfur reductase-like enzyme